MIASHRLSGDQSARPTPTITSPPPRRTTRSNNTRPDTGCRQSERWTGTAALRMLWLPPRPVESGGNPSIGNSGVVSKTMRKFVPKDSRGGVLTNNVCGAADWFCSITFNALKRYNMRFVGRKYFWMSNEPNFRFKDELTRISVFDATEFSFRNDLFIYFVWLLTQINVLYKKKKKQYVTQYRYKHIKI